MQSESIQGRKVFWILSLCNLGMTNERIMKSAYFAAEYLCGPSENFV